MDDKFYLDLALEEAKKGNCKNRNYGCVIVDKYGDYFKGYTKLIKGTECSNCNTCYRKENNIPHGEGYEKCGSIHAEQMALINYDGIAIEKVYLACYENGKETTEGVKPCPTCAKMLKYAGAKEVITRTGVIKL